MKNFIYGLVVGFILAFVFIFFSGGEYLQKLGKKTEKAGERVVDYEADLKKQVEKARVVAKEKAKAGAEVVKEKAKEGVAVVKEKAKEGAEVAKEKLKEGGEAVKEKAKEAAKESIKEAADENL